MRFEQLVAIALSLIIAMLMIIAKSDPQEPSRHRYRDRQCENDG
jgi:hypothetical protein